MATLNKWQGIGRLTDDPEAPRTLPNSGSTVVKFRFAVGRSRKNPQTGQWESDPNPLYIDCEVFTRPDDTRNLCNVVSQYCQKGSQIYVEGRLQYETWDDKNGGGKRSKHKVIVESIQLLDSKSGGGDEQQGGGQQQQPQRQQNNAPPRQQPQQYGQQPGRTNRPPQQNAVADQGYSDNNQDIPF